MLNGKVYGALAAIQAELKAPKSQFNKFGGYKYRKAEDILEAVKPLLAKYGCALTCSDDLVRVGERYYIKATAMLICVEDCSCQSCEAYAREEEEKKGMDGSQVTGASSSYARKYALNGLLCIDDTADSDTTNTGDNKPEPATKKAPAKTQDNDYLPGGKFYENTIKAYCEGKKTKAGNDIREWWIEKVKAGEDLAEVFDHDVATYKMYNNIKPIF